MTARREIVREVIGSTSVEDPYRWLDDPSPESLAWGAAEDARTTRYLQEWPHYKAVREQMASAIDLYPAGDGCR